MSDTKQTAAQFEQALAHIGAQRIELRLFVAGMGLRSTTAIADLKNLCDTLFGDRCTVEIVDIYEHPEAAMKEQIVAVPTLVRERPLPQRKVIGAIGDLAKVARALALLPAGTETKA